MGSGRERAGLAARRSAGWGAGRQVEVLVLPFAVALGSRICTSAAPRSAFWGPGSTAGICETLCLPAVALPQRKQARQRYRQEPCVSLEASSFLPRRLPQRQQQHLGGQTFCCKCLAETHLPGQATAPAPLPASSAAPVSHLAAVTKLL